MPRRSNLKTLCFLQFPKPILQRQPSLFASKSRIAGTSEGIGWFADHAAFSSANVVGSMTSADPIAQLPALLINGRFHPICPARPADMLLEQVKGPYTTARITAGFRAEAWQEHVLRLARAVATLNQQQPAAFAGLMGSLQGGSDAEAELQRVLDERLQRDLAALAPLAAAEACAEMALTILLCSTGSDSDSGGLDIISHAMRLQPSAGAKPAVVAVVGYGRRIPEVKHSQWVLDRQPFLRELPEQATEGILCNGDGCLLEGILTNLFIVADDGSGGVMVATAGVDDGVLAGVMRAHVLLACAGLGLPVVESAPHWSSHGRWREAFLTNRENQGQANMTALCVNLCSLRGLQPIRRIMCTRPGLCSKEPWIVTLPPLKANALTNRLQTSVAGSLAKVTEPLGGQAASPLSDVD